MKIRFLVDQGQFCPGFGGSIEIPDQAWRYLFAGLSLAGPTKNIEGCLIYADALLARLKEGDSDD